MIQLTSDLGFQGYGRFPEYLVRTENFKDRIQDLTTSFKALGNLYLEKLGGDKKVTGLEKKLLSESIESVLVYVLLLRKIDFSPLETISKIERKNDKFYITLKFPNEGVWEIEGAMRPEYSIKAKSFRDIFNGPLSEKLKLFLGTFAHAVSDKIVTEEEKQNLTKALDQIALELVELFVFVERFMLFD